MMKRRWFLTVFLVVMAALFTVAVKFVDVQGYGASCLGIDCVKFSEIGFSKINFVAFSVFGASEMWDKITDVIKLAMLASGSMFALIGAYQLIKRKKLSKVDWEILMLGVVYVVLGLLYVFFEKIVINDRPILVDGELGASFPSSHVLLAITIGITVMMLLPKYVNNRKMRSVIGILLTLMIILMIIGRLLSGMHWLTDVIAGFLYSAALISLYDNLLKIKEEK